MIKVGWAIDLSFFLAFIEQFDRFLTCCYFWVWCIRLTKLGEAAMRCRLLLWRGKHLPACGCGYVGVNINPPSPAAMLGKH